MFWKVLEIKFHIIILSETDARNIGTVEHLLLNHDFHFVLPRDNYFGVLVFVFINTYLVSKLWMNSVYKSPASA